MNPKLIKESIKNEAQRPDIQVLLSTFKLGWVKK